MRTFVLAVAAVALTACDTPRPAKSVKLMDGAVIATAPAGYCIDPSTSNPEAGFAVIAPCINLGSGDKAPDVFGVATMQVGGPGSGSVTGAEDDLRDLLESDAGAQLLSQTGQADQINVQEAETGENTVRVYFDDAGTPPVDGTQSEEWRAFTDIGGRLVTVGVRGLAAAPLAKDNGAWLLGLIVNGIVANQTVAEPPA